jgi:hypothetical protein
LLCGAFTFVNTDSFKVVNLLSFYPVRSTFNLAKNPFTKLLISSLIFLGSRLEETKIKYKPKIPLVFYILAAK